MVTNERAYAITNAAAEKFRAGIAAAERDGPPKNVAPKLHKLSIDAMRAQLAELEADMRAYDELKIAKGKRGFADTLDRMTLLLTKCRIARGWTQQELAEKLGRTKQQVQADEAGGYARAGIERVLQVLQACGATATVKIDLISLPANVEELFQTPAAAGKGARKK